MDEDRTAAGEPVRRSDSSSHQSSRSAAFEAIVTSAGIGALAGVLSAVVWGGVGGRVAMRVLFLTSNERVRGLTSDDGFEIGVISSATVFLFMFTAFLGAFAGALQGPMDHERIVTERLHAAGVEWFGRRVSYDVVLDSQTRRTRTRTGDVIGHLRLPARVGHEPPDNDRVRPQVVIATALAKACDGVIQLRVSRGRVFSERAIEEILKR